MSETICAECGCVEEADELLPVLLRGEPALICLRCIAAVARYMR